tara:strand:+ start:5209 stop:6861 length:1653 start_codon:yes stop_codon:yes gene_type:complete
MEIKEVSARVKKALQKKADDQNKKAGDDSRKKTNVRTLSAVFERGVGAYNTNPGSVRPSVTSSDQWAYARVNSYIYALNNLKFRGGKHDTDLLPASHPMSTRKQLFDDTEVKGIYDDLDFTIPKGAKDEAKRGLEWRKEYGRGGTSVGINSARYIVNNTTAGAEKVRHIAKYFPRHEVDKQAEGYRQGEEGYPSNGRIAWALWGGNAGKSWSQKLVRAMNKRDEQAKSASVLIERINKTKDLDQEFLANEFETKESKIEVWNSFNDLLKSWDSALAKEYFDLLKVQEFDAIKLLKQYPNNLNAVQGIINSQIDRTTNNWKADLYDLYMSMITDFSYWQIELLLPETIKRVKQTQPKRTKPRQQIIANGFLPIRTSNALIPMPPAVRNSESIKFVSDRLDTSMPELARTTKKRLNVALRRSVDEARALGLTGSAFDDYVANGISDVLGKKRINRALTIARTEGLAISQHGMEQAVKKSKLDTEKEWITRKDGIVRDQHRRMDGKRLNFSKSFNVAGYKMDYPADTKYGATAELVVNCRCSLIYHRKKRRSI